ncbi:hypothetical protein MJJ08_12580 [Xanthomonas oryzae]|uniref:hypothetical protein n=1 Tax=Xanthomonas oryzae TaxID=347 RepID=UPI0023B13E5E|nr:hypothetical protein [Xanthomonas oryzae]WEE99807.1 hypothetical protein MJJ08_12580 [Xanthomonas oryzae]
MSYRPQNNQDGLWWEIALGIFVGQLMTAAFAGVVALCLGFTLRSVSAGLPAPRLLPVTTGSGLNNDL